MIFVGYLFSSVFLAGSETPAISTQTLVVCDEDRWLEPKVWGYIYKNAVNVSLTFYRPGR